MKFPATKTLLLISFIFYAGYFQVWAQKSTVHYDVTLGAALSANETLPFWLASNRYGSVPNTNHLLLNAAIYSNLKKPENNFGISYKFSATGFIANENIATGYVADKNALLINEGYLRLQYKNWGLDIGNRNDQLLWEGLSSSNGHIIKSTNARAIPGINIKTLDYLPLPFAKKWLRFQLNFANYWLNDHRMVDRAMLHHAGLFFKFKLNPTLDLIAGMDHYAQWGGSSPISGKQPSTFKDFMRIVMGKSGGSSSLEMDQQNALGNHVGAYLLQLNYNGHNSNLNFYYSHPFEDASGMELQNWMDGLYGFMVDLKKPNAPISHILAEFTYTKHMSGKNKADRVDENGNKLPGRGHDNYFNNGAYGSGWTYFGHCIGSPYFTTVPVNANGITNGVIKGDNRFTAFNAGLKGTLNPIHYKAMLSYITYFGWFENEYDPKPKQLSGLLEVRLPQHKRRIPFDITASFSFDAGSYQPINLGGFLTLTKRGIF